MRRLFAVTSAAGGSGATTIAANFAYELAEQIGRSTILIELAQQMGSLASMFDLQPRVTLPHRIRGIPPPVMPAHREVRLPGRASDPFFVARE